MTTDYDDDPLRARLRAVDPAAALPPLPADRRDRHLEDAMTAIEPTATVAPLRRRRTTWLIGGGIGVAAAAAGVMVLTTGGPDVTRLTQSATDPMAMCAQVTAEALAPNTLAFEGTVTGIDGSTVTLDVSERFRGEIGDEVAVTQQDAAAADFSAVPYVRGTAYLIAATDGRVATCGRSGEAGPELRELYRRAFGG
ncbi:hypothetical protein [Nakamurella deserti]|uniref:hypothetical protein n=1 Tax=Nakamurella deserti TaxID=2164074 RepID=UPI000DBE86D0|nr:hypothetical protein [Nakamurella deserti]